MKVVKRHLIGDSKLDSRYLLCSTFFNYFWATQPLLIPLVRPSWSSSRISFCRFLCQSRRNLKSVKRKACVATKYVRHSMKHVFISFCSGFLSSVCFLSFSLISSCQCLFWQNRANFSMRMRWVYTVQLSDRKGVTTIPFPVSYPTGELRHEIRDCQFN